MRMRRVGPRRLCRVIYLAGALAPSLLPGQTPGGDGGLTAVERVATVGFTVSDMDRSVAFFSDVLTFETVTDVELAGAEYESLHGVFPVRMRKVRMRLGAEEIELTEYLAPRGRPIPIEFRSQDRWFQHIAIVVRDMDEAYRRLREHKVEHVSSGPQRLPDWNPNAGGIEAFYFRDPDGHVLEIISFPEGKGDPRWRQSTGRLFLGIDHTAIVVDDTERSLPFYRDHLGFRVAGESENYGPEQERLNAVRGARLRITGLRAPSGPGIEFLDYLTPADGRPMPEDERASDLFHWETTLDACDPGAVASGLRSAGAEFVSAGLVTLPGDELGFREAFLVRDPDGHVMRIAGAGCE
ncbi:MAG TPA: VOC family protein [Gemmatimonadota bacterium]|nr:VOC family protein [Gemmatimonadota bacterium]